MKQSIYQNISQGINLTPRLKAAIEILQLSAHELNEKIQTATEENPLLELEDDSLIENEDKSRSSCEIEFRNSDISEMKSNFSRTDSSYTREGYENLFTENKNNLFFGENFSSIKDDLRVEVYSSSLTDNEKYIAEFIIDSIGKDGILCSSIKEIKSSIEFNVTDALMDKVLSYLQSLGPVGIAAKNFKESLLLQLKNLPKKCLELDIAIKIVENHLAELGSYNYEFIKKHYNLDAPMLRNVINLIRSLNPRPCSEISDFNVEYVVPDLYVRIKNDELIVKLNSGAIKALRVNKYYSSLVNSGKNQQEKEYITKNLQEAVWLIKSIKNRSAILLLVGAWVLGQQVKFLEFGKEQLRPLTLKDAADNLGLHESTISRVIANKYVDTPNGIFKLKSFFSTYMATTSGDHRSAASVESEIKKLIEGENKETPLKDQEIVNILKKSGLPMARRTVAKYREALNILPSFKRKRFNFS